MVDKQYPQSDENHPRKNKCCMKSFLWRRLIVRILCRQVNQRQFMLFTWKSNSVCSLNTKNAHIEQYRQKQDIKFFSVFLESICGIGLRQVMTSMQKWMYDTSLQCFGLTTSMLILQVLLQFHTLHLLGIFKYVLMTCGS